MVAQKKYHEDEGDKLSKFFGQFPRQSFPTSRVGLSTATPPRLGGSGVSVAIPIAEPDIRR